MSSQAPYLRPILPFRIMLDEANRLTRSHFMQIYPAVAIPMALAGVVMVLVQRPMLGDMLSVSASSLGPQFFASWLGLMAIGLMYLLIYWIASCVILVGAIKAVVGQPVDMSEAWRWLLQPRILSTLVMVALLMTVGFLFCLIPGYLVGVLFGLVVPIMVLEQVYGTQAMSQSQNRLMYNPEGDWQSLPFLRLALIWFVGWLIAYIVGMAVGLPFGIAQQYMAWRSISSGEGMSTMGAIPPLWLQIPQVVLGTLARHAVTLYVSFCVALFYLDISNRREGSDLDAALDAAGAPSVPAPLPPQVGI